MQLFKMENVIEFKDILTPSRNISPSFRTSTSKDNRKWPVSCIKEEPDNKDNITGTNSTRNSDRDTEKEDLKNKNKRSRKKRTNAKNEESEEKFVIVRKLTKSTNLKTFNPKFQPANQTRLDRYFKIEPKPNKNGYFNTFTQSKPSNLHTCPGDFGQGAREQLKRMHRPRTSSSSGLVTADLDENNKKNFLKKSRQNERISPSSSIEDFSVSAFYPQKKKSSAMVRKSQDSGKRNSAKVPCKFKNGLVEHNSQISDECSDSDFTSSKLQKKLNAQNKLKLKLINNKPGSTNISIKSSLNVRIRRPSEEFQSSQTPANKIHPGSSKTADRTYTSNMNSNIIDLSLDVTPEKGEHIEYNVRNNVCLRHGEGTSNSDSINKEQINSKKCPDYKIIEGTTFAVDAFRFGNIEGITHYFLTHFHADHYIGLKKTFDHPIYLSQITKNLVDEFIHVNEAYLHVMQLNVPIMIKDIEVTACDANHCPGAVMFLFKFPNNICTLHTGDFRASMGMESEPAFWNNAISTIYLDTTYISRNYEFKLQDESIDDVIAHMKMFEAKHAGEKILYICGSYVIGKEKVWMAMAKNNNLKVWTNQNRRRALNAINDKKMLQYLVDDPKQAAIHVLPMGHLSYDYLCQYLNKYSDQFDIILAFRPSGWEKNSKPQFRGRVNIVGIEYSEHSNCKEMRRFVCYLQPKKIISTVPVGKDLMQTANIPSHWLNNSLKKKTIGWQRSITNFVKITGQCKPKNIPDYKDEMWELENARANTSFEDIEMQDATRSISENGSERSKLLIIFPEEIKSQNNLSSRSSTDWMS